MDDDEIYRRALWRQFRRAMEIAGAPTIETGLRAATRTAPTVILLDVHLPDGCGLDSIRDFRRAAPNASIIVATADYWKDAGIEAIRSGALAYLEKGDGETLRRLVLAAARQAA